MLLLRRTVSLFVPALAVVGAACAPAPMPISQSSHDPSSPNAPAGVTAVTGATSAAPAPIHAADGGASTVYVCPMHPEVTSSTADSCPKCHMKLVPKK